VRDVRERGREEVLLKGRKSKECGKEEWRKM
jgi:hypothetical protein